MAFIVGIRNKAIARGSIYSNLPDSLRHKASFSMTVDNMGYEMQFVKNLPELAGKKITLSYAPATASDEAAINAYLPKAHTDGTPIQPSELPSSLPAYLINLKPELRIEGVVVATGSSITMGQDEFFNISIAAPTTATHSISNKMTAGEFNAFALDISRITPEQMTALKTKLEATKAKLEAQNFMGLTKDDILGDLLYTTVVSYFAELDAMDYVSAKAIGVFASRLPSVGRFFNALSVDYMWGMPVSASASGLSMDIGLVRKLVKTPDGSKDKQLQFMMTSGMNSSALEHSVPEELFSTTSNPAQGISAVKALQIANEQGIPIYTINQTNISTILSQLQLDGNTTSDIQSAVNAGQIVTVSQTNITFNGWTGCGYIIIDPTTGAGAYMIQDGLSGARILSALKSLIINLYLLPSGRGFDEVINSYEVIKEELSDMSYLYEYELDYLLCVKSKLIIAPDGNFKEIPAFKIIGLLADIFVAAQLISVATIGVPFIVLAGAWAALVLGFGFMITMMVNIGISCKNQ